MRDPTWEPKRDFKLPELIRLLLFEIILLGCLEMSSCLHYEDKRLETMLYLERALLMYAQRAKDNVLRNAQQNGSPFLTHNERNLKEKSDDLKKSNLNARPTRVLGIISPLNWF